MLLVRNFIIILGPQGGDDGIPTFDLYVKGGVLKRGHNHANVFAPTTFPIKMRSKYEKHAFNYEIDSHIQYNMSMMIIVIIFDLVANCVKIVL